jgi:hypothetical protein
MKKTITTFMALVLLLLTGCATLAPSPTTTPAPTETSVPTLATSDDDLIGIWQFGSGNFALFFQFDEDGTYRVAQRVVTNLQDSPNQLGQFMVEGGLLTLVTSDESVLCAGQTGTYEVHLLEQGRIDMVLQEDPCSLRAAAIYSGLEPFSP